MTLIEVVVSLFMIGGLIVLYAASFNIVFAAKHMRQENVAYHIANTEMEYLRSITYASLPPSNSFTDTQMAQLGGTPTGSFTIADFGTYNGLKEIIVTVNWNDGKPRSIVLRSLVGTGGINP